MAAAAVTAIGVHDPARPAIMQAARGTAQSDIGKPVRFLADTLNRQGDWVFLLAAMQDVHGRPIDFAGSKLAAAASEGMVSDRYAALLHRRGASWTVIAHATGPTDVAWEGWAEEYGAPAELFAR